MKTCKKLLSICLSVMMLLSVMVMPTGVLSVSAATAEDVQTAAKLYVQTYKNNATKEGLLEYVQTAVEDTSITLADADFFIKHAVPGATDVMANGSTNEYPLNIEGSDGAVVAIFGVGGARVSVSCAFAHSTEVITVSNVAVADKTLQDTTYFTYDANGNITAFKGGADKIVIPADFPGAFECDCTSAGNDSTYDNVKVMIVNNQKPLGNRAYYSWNNLIAFQMADSDTGWDVFPKPGGNNGGLGGGWMQFAQCKKLKYVKFPSKISASSSSWWYAFSDYLFEGCTALENVNLPEFTAGGANRTMRKMAFKGTAVRDFFFPAAYTYNPAAEASQQVFTSPSFTEGTRNLFLYTDDMTFARAVALAAAEVNELVRNDDTVVKSDVVAAVLAVITNAHNAETLRNSITTEWADNYTLSLTYGGDTVALAVPFPADSAGSASLQKATEKYVAANENNATKEGLLEYVQTAMGDTSITLADADFFIKHAVPGATDVMANGSTNEYPLNIEGSDGAVVAIFGVGGARVSVSCAFAHSTEVITVSNVAVADKTLQDTTYFTYDANGNITAFKGGADKIVIPADFPGAFETDLTSYGNDSTYDNVKVMIVNNQKPLGNRAYYSWNNLVAFQMADSDTGWDVFPKPGGNNGGLGGGWMQFAQCKKLKYVKLPSKISASNSSWWTAFSQYIFEGCAALENVNLPILSGSAKREMKKNEFKGTAVRDFFFPETYYYNPAAEATQQVFTSPSFTEGTRNLFLYTDDMTFARAVALAVAECNELYVDSTLTTNEILAGTKAAITGAHNAATLLSGMTITLEQDVLTLSDGIDTVSVVMAETPACEHEYDYDCDAECNLCGETREASHEYFYACDARCEICGEITNEEAAHAIVAVEAKDATCDAEGNIAYWYCEICGSVWADEALTQVTNLKNVILPVAHNVVHVEAVAPTCDAEGNIEYWYCDICGAAWTDELCREVTNLKNVILPVAHNVVHVEAVAPTCDAEGNIEYWYCDICGAAWTDELCREVTNLKNVILPVAHNVIHVEAKDATCDALGNIEYWYCDICGQAWLDELCHLNTNLMAVKLPMAEHTYDNDFDVDCNDCGAIREVEQPVIATWTSASEDVKGLAVKFDVSVAGLAIVDGTKTEADYTNATLNGYKLIEMGAIANNNVSSKTIQAKVLCELEDDSASFNVRIINIPENKQDVEITFTPYFVVEIDGVETTIYGDAVVSSYAAVLG